MAQVVAVCISKKRGERKKDVGQRLLVVDSGLEGDGHAGFQHRQVSLLALESIEKMREMGLDVGPGDFAENLTTVGIDLVGIPVGERLQIGAEAILRVTQIGKECHHRCAIYHQAGDCVMPNEGIFAEVLRGGLVQTGDQIRRKPTYRLGVLTASDRGAQGLREDLSGKLIEKIVRPFGDVVQYALVEDDRECLRLEMEKMVDQHKVDLLLTTGGTGFGPRDVTPEATLDVCQRLAPGIAEAMRLEGLRNTPRAILSRAVAGLRGSALIINLPGSPRGVEESLQALLPVLEHALEIATGRGGECG